MSTPYENVPQRIGNSERDTAVQQLRVHLDAGRLDQATYDERVASALAATTQDDLDPLFRDLPPVVTSTPTYELYPHQSLATTSPSPYANDLTEPSPYAAPTPYLTPEPRPVPWIASIPPWLRIVFTVMIVSVVVAMASHGGWWIIFFLPGILGAWGGRRNMHMRNRSNGQRPY